MIVRFYDIQWDTEDNGEQVDVDLPAEVTLQVGDELDVVNEGADVLSENYGWCVNTFDFDIVG